MSKIVNEIIEILDCKYDIQISMYDKSFLENSINNRLLTLGFEKLSEYIVFLKCNSEEVKNLLLSLNINYTDFFRNTLAFAHLEEWILPNLIGNKSEGSEVRIWCAGCSSGQEAYSISMLLNDLNKVQSKELRYRIIATDISETVLSIAKKGEYSEKDINNIKVKHINEYFVKKGEAYTVSEKLKECLSFSNYNLLDLDSYFPYESIFGEFDIVFCSNLLFYYRHEHQQYILKKLFGAMSENAYLITGQAEKYLAANFKGLHMISSPTSIFQKKRI